MSNLETAYADIMNLASEGQLRKISIDLIPRTLVHKLVDDRGKDLGFTLVHANNSCLMKPEQLGRSSNNNLYELHPVYQLDSGDTLVYEWLSVIVTPDDLVELQPGYFEFKKSIVG